MAYEQEFEELERDLLNVLKQWGNDSTTLNLWDEIKDDVKQEFENKCHWSSVLSESQYFPSIFSDALIAMQQQRAIMLAKTDSCLDFQAIRRLNNATRQVANLPEVPLV